MIRYRPSKKKKTLIFFLPDFRLLPSFQNSWWVSAWRPSQPSTRRSTVSTFKGGPTPQNTRTDIYHTSIHFRLLTRTNCRLPHMSYAMDYNKCTYVTAYPFVVFDILNFVCFFYLLANMILYFNNFKKCCQMPSQDQKYG